MFFDEYNLYEPGDKGYCQCRIPALLTTSKGTILAFTEARKFTGRDSDQIDLFLRRSFDGGKGFEDVQIVATEEGWVCGNPAPVQDRETGTIWLPFCKNLRDGPEKQIRTGKAPRTVWITSSNDDGATWVEPKEITGDVKPDNWGWYATGPGHSIQLRSGRMVVACDHTAMDNEEPQKVSGHSHIIYSDDHGASWKLGGITDNGANECTAVETADGWLCLNCRNHYLGKDENPYYRRVAWSRDGGGSFSPSVRDGALPEPICQASVCRYTLKSDGPGAKNRILFSNPGIEQAHQRHHLTMRLSYDECRTWPVSRVICEGPSAYSDICIAADGAICCLYERGHAGGVSKYSGNVTFARFDLEWLTRGEDRI